jgi:hypothetical protein
MWLSDATLARKNTKLSKTVEPTAAAKPFVDRGPLGPCRFPPCDWTGCYQLAPPFGWESSILGIPDWLSKGDFEVFAIPLELPVID